MADNNKISSTDRVVETENVSGSDEMDGEPRESRVERAYREIKQRILSNLFPPNFQALEQELAETLGVSRTPVREALIRLEREGLVEVLPRRGMRVVPISPDDMREIYEVLICLEARAASLLAERKPGPAEIQFLESACDDMEAALERRDLDAWAEADHRFHGALLELSGNRRLANIGFTVADQVHRARLVTLRMRPLPLYSNQEHRNLVEAIRSGDAAGACEIHSQHLRTAMTILTELIERSNLREL